ncbi:putative retrotransposon hot spot protein 4 (RHS4) [Trypanosoma vivax]|nr:putative retrotransposon hot spot protein 4 (RHS4) [Trypanosoma vivax]
MSGRSRRVRQDKGGGAGEPPLSRARLEDEPGPRWTLNSDVADVLLRGARPPEKVKLSSFIAYLGIANIELTGDARMSVFVNKPEVCIPDEHARRRILSLPECQTYALVYRAVPLLKNKGIAGLLQWGVADENADAKRAVRDALADDVLWNTVRGLLDAAFNVAKNA